MEMKYTFYTGTGKNAKGEDITDREKREDVIDFAFQHLKLTYTKWKAVGTWEAITEPVLIYEFIGISEDIAESVKQALQTAFEQTEVFVTVAEVKTL